MLKKGDKVFVSPELTGQRDWIPGVIVQIENNPFRGKVITVETEFGQFFDVEASFKEYSKAV